MASIEMCPPGHQPATARGKLVPGASSVLEWVNDAQLVLAEGGVMGDRELLELAAKAARISFDKYVSGFSPEDFHYGLGSGLLKIDRDKLCAVLWNPLADDGDRYRLAKRLGISIDFADCCAWKRLPSGDLIQEWWGGDCGDEAHAVVRAAAEIGKKIDAPQNAGD